MKFKIRVLNFKMKPANTTVCFCKQYSAVKIEGCSRQRGELTEVGTLQDRCDRGREISELSLFTRE